MRSEYEQQAAKALEYLGLALTCAKNARAPRTAARIRSAISSAKEAVRAARYRALRDEPMTKEEFEAIKSRPGIQCETERGTEYWYDTLTDEEGREIAFAAYHTGSAPTYHRRTDP